MDVRLPWADDPAPATPPGPDPQRRAKPRGRRPAAASGRSATSPWLYHHLTLAGPAANVAAFAAAARGAGVIPWQLDDAAIEEDIFNLAVAQPPHRRRLTVEGCRLLARQFRERVQARQGRAAQRVGRSQACPFDLHALLPVPDAVLALGPTHPDALAWLRANWGIEDGLRQVVERPRASIGRRLRAGHAVVGYGFFTAGGTPAAAAEQLQARWAALAFVLAPRPDG